MAKKAMINKQQKPAKFSTRAYTRCSICGRPHAVLRKYGIDTADVKLDLGYTVKVGITGI